MSSDRSPREAMERVAALQSRLAEALEAGDLTGWESLSRELRLAERDRDRAMERAVARVHREQGSYVTALPAPTSREQTHAVLEGVRVPLSPQQIISVAAAVYAQEIPYKAVTSLRHDEKKAHVKAPGARSYYICPALQHDTLAPTRGLLTSSSWDLAERILAPLTTRTAHLRLTTYLADALDRTRESGGSDSPDAIPLERLLWRLGATVPGVRRGELNTDRLRDAAHRELEVLDDRDRADREEAAARAARLPEAQQLFGAPLKAVRPADETDQEAGP
ncbi:hypothetical protein ACI8AF_21730 [Blastococcus sp. SYSU D00669]